MSRADQVLAVDEAMANMFFTGQNGSKLRSIKNGAPQNTHEFVLTDKSGKEVNIVLDPSHVKNLIKHLKD